MNTLYFAGGCFWGTEALFRALPGVHDVTAGYANGDSPDHANYPAVCSGVTGFRETVKVAYDPAALSLERLLFTFFAAVDPDTPNRQGPDVGSQYQAGVYWTDSRDEAVIRRIFSLERADVPGFAVECGPLASFYPAEEVHQRYLEKKPGGYCHIAPWKRTALTAYPFDAKTYNRPAAALLRQWQAQREEG